MDPTVWANHLCRNLGAMIGCPVYCSFLFKSNNMILPARALFSACTKLQLHYYRWRLAKALTLASNAVEAIREPGTCSGFMSTCKHEDMT